MEVSIIDSADRDRLYGHNGPGPKDTGTCWEIRKIDGDLVAVCTFEGWPGYWYLGIENLLHANTEDTQTYWSTR
jgi:hypothetical protein